jgi:4-amino-4-deoxy-L-arabinose transferase-like glycosyltransferase
MMMLNPSPSKIFWVALLLVAGLIVLNGMATEVSLGDESHHYRFAQNIYTEGKRAPFDPLYGSGKPPGFFYNAPPFWHFLLAFLWKMTGGISQATAQVYHVLFFILLIWLTSLLARELIGEEKRWFPALIIATVPMVVSFSTLLYMDVPMTALSTFGFYLILRKRYFGAGMASGLAYFTKLNAGFFFPGFLFLIVWNERGRILVLLKNLCFFTLPILMIYIVDLYWRKIHITSGNSVGWSSASSLFAFTRRRREYLNSNLTNPIDLIKYFGLVFLFLAFLHLFSYRRWDRKGLIFWVPVISYLMAFLITFRIESDIRYLLPIFPFLVALFTPHFLSLGKRWQFVLIGICILQFGGTTYYVHQKRQISPEVKEGFEYISRNVSGSALILYPEENLLVYAHRKMVWSAVSVYRSGKEVGLYGLFWANDLGEMNEALKASHIDYILIKKSRIYDDREEQHLGGYPKSFVEKLPQLDGLLKVFENPGVALWKKVPS